jgi:hypothetical protein
MSCEARGGLDQIRFPLRLASSSSIANGAGQTPHPRRAFPAVKSSDTPANHADPLFRIGNIAEGTDETAEPTVQSNTTNVACALQTSAFTWTLQEPIPRILVKGVHNKEEHFMSVRSFAKLFPLLLLFFGGLAFAQQPGSTTGPASGKNVEPSTAIQKENTGRPSAAGEELQGYPNAAGAPGVEGKPGAESGAAPKGPTTQPSK